MLRFIPVAYWYQCKICKVCIQDQDKFIAHKIIKHSEGITEAAPSIEVDKTKNVDTKNSISSVSEVVPAVRRSKRITKKVPSFYKVVYNTRSPNPKPKTKNNSARNVKQKQTGKLGEIIEKFLSIQENRHDGISRCECDSEECEAVSPEVLRPSEPKITKPQWKIRAPRSIISMNNFKVQRKAYEEMNPYPCGLCNRKFQYLAGLYTHLIAVHNCRNEHGTKTGRKLPCDFCGKVFFASGNLRQHMWVHTGEQPHKCGICDKRFTFKQRLENHIKTAHTKEKPFCCEICNNRFTFKQCLTYHLNNVHRNGL